MKTNLVLSAAVLAVSFGSFNPAFASAAPVPTEGAAEIRLGDISAGGTGCVGGFLSSEASFDQMMVRLRFDRFGAEVVDEGRRMDRKACSIAIPVLQVAKDKRLAVAKVVLAGSRDLAQGSSASVSIESFFSGFQGVKAENAFGASVGEFEMVQADSATMSCGSEGIFRLNTSALVQNFGTAQINEVVVFFKLLPCLAK